MARDVSPAVLSNTVEHGVSGAVVEWIEGKVEMHTVANTSITHGSRHSRVRAQQQDRVRGQ
ncbi:hypothetical protein C8Q78DRAFT_1029665 [Trametes maxima]|nr:hypothetical protein C8Q78DRAFT_1029665 [Trametes maxima]